MQHVQSRSFMYRKLTIGKLTIIRRISLVTSIECYYLTLTMGWNVDSVKSKKRSWRK